MPWTKVAKGSASYSSVAKPSLTIQRGRLLTPDGEQILVGTSVDEILIYQEFKNLWTKVAKPSI